MKILLTAGLGAAAMYYLDPVQGRERRDIARERLEHGRESLQHASHTARAVGHDVGQRTDRAIHGMRAAGHEFSGRAGKAMHRARSVGQGIGDRTGRLAHGLREIGHDTRERAAGAVSSLGSLFDRGRSGSRRSKGHSALKLAGIPVKWLLVAGIGATAMYYLDPSQGLYRRVRFRNRFLAGRSRRVNGSGLPEDEDAETAARRSRSSLHDEERPLPG